MPFMWSMGTIIGPVIGRTLARPAIYYPSIFASDGLFGRFPYLLPNLVCAALILVAMIQGYCFLEETHPDLQQHKEEEEEDEEVEETILYQTSANGCGLDRDQYPARQALVLTSEEAPTAPCNTSRYPAPSTKSHRQTALNHPKPSLTV
jgi:hypothetical protein